MACEFCEIIQGEGKAEVLYQDTNVVIAVRDHVLTPGQITIFPKQHIPILEMVPGALLAKCSILANKVSMAAFESLGSNGTNILVRNGLGAGQNVSHFSIEVIPRQEGDGLSFQWNPQQVTEEGMERISSLLQQSLATITVGQDMVVAQETEEAGQSSETTEKKDNYLLKSIKRIP